MGFRGSCARRTRQATWLGAVGLLACSACGGKDSTVLSLEIPDVPDPQPALPQADESSLPEPTRRTGFIDIDAAEYSWLYRVQYGMWSADGSSYSTAYRQAGPLTSTPTRLFYNFIPADEDAKSRPLFVIFNGGPGATSMYLHSLGTGPFSLSEADWSRPPEQNPYSLSALGNLLYIDARLAGFSYALSNAPDDEAERAAAFDEQSLNPGRDAADFVQVLLRVLAAQPALQNNPVVLLGESAGGTRAALMLEILLDPPRAPGEARLYDDAALDAELEQHYAAVFGSAAVASLTPDLKALQFGWQALIQPGVIPNWQLDIQTLREPERLERLAALPGFVGELGCDHHARSARWCAERDAAVDRAMLSPSEFEALLGVAPSRVPRLSAPDRERAFRCQKQVCGGPDAFPMPQPSPEWSSALGELPPYDSYFMPFRDQGFAESDLYHERARFSFVRVAPYVETLITNALWDIVVESEAIVPTLREYIAIQPTPWLAAAEYEGDDPDQVSEAIVLRYADHPDYGPARSRRIAFPAYPDSGHMVPSTEPEKFRADVRAFLEQTGALACLRSPSYQPAAGVATSSVRERTTVSVFDFEKSKRSGDFSPRPR